MAENVLYGPVGVFDSGYGGLTILRELRRIMPEYDYVYLGDNARAPYGTRSFDVVYRFTLEAVEKLFALGCPLVILACNTASAKALRTIQQHDLPSLDPRRRVLGVIRPTAERVGELSAGRHVGVLGTPGTVYSRSYEMEIGKLHPDVNVVAQACPLWVPLVENMEAEGPGADFFVDKYIGELFAADAHVDTVVLACTHYPLLLPKIQRAVGSRARVVTQGDIVARSLRDYMSRHPEMDSMCSKGGTCRYLTTENPEKFTALASVFMSEPIKVAHVEL